MKRIIALILIIMLLVMTAFAENLVNLIPVSSVWGASRTAFISDSGYSVVSVKVGDSDGLKLSNIDIESYTMDAYYVFSKKMKTHAGFSKLAYIYNGGHSASDAELKKCRDTMVNAVKRDVGSPTSESGSVTKWEYADQTIEIGIGKFKNYTGSSAKTVGIIVKGTNISTAAGKNIDSSRANVPTGQTAMRVYMFDPISRTNNMNSFAYGLYTIQGSTYQSGSQGQAVSEIQNMLAMSGFLNAGDVDGVYGNKTANAISSFQSMNGLAQNGIADLPTQFMLVIKAAPLYKRNSCYIAQLGKFAVAIWPLKAFYIGTLDNSGGFSEGTYYYVSGEYYSGEYRNNMRSGRGTAHFSNGDVYIGQWADDDMQGQGIYYFGGEGSSKNYNGSMSNNTMSGNGTYRINGATITGTWSKNQHKSWS